MMLVVVYFLLTFSLCLSVTLLTSVPPAIDEANLVDNPKIVVNRTVLLECPVSGSPVPDVVWLNNGEALRLDGNVHVEGRHLEIRRARVTDTARYTCIASNEAGELRRSFDLEVLGLTFTLFQSRVRRTASERPCGALYD